MKNPNEALHRARPRRGITSVRFKRTRVRSSVPPDAMPVQPHTGSLYVFPQRTAFLETEAQAEERNVKRIGVPTSFGIGSLMVAAGVLATGALAPASARGGVVGRVARSNMLEWQGGGQPHGGACNAVARDTLRACWHSAMDDYWIAKANCDNAPSGTDSPGGAASASGAGNDCDRSALQDRNDALQVCADQLQLRKQICNQLGGGPYSPSIDAANFSTTIDNPYSPMVPGTTFVYEGQTADGFDHDEVHVTSDTRTILGVPCVAVRDTESLDGVLSEDTTDWFAQDSDGNVWYFGEDARQYTDGFLSGTEGSWVAGVDGALPGIVMEANPKVGDVYRQEYAIGDAEDMAQVLAFGQSVSVPYGSYSDALETFEFSGLEPGSTEHKYYESGLGLLLAVDDQTGDRSELVSVTH
jgi:hypothetical protein